MDNVENSNTIEEELENLRKKLNSEVGKNIRYTNNEEYGRLLAISKKLDNVIVKYIRSSKR